MGNTCSPKVVNAMDDTWSAAEKASAARELTRFDRWKKNRLFVGLGILCALVLLLALTTGFVFFFHSNTPTLKTPMALKNPCDQIYCAFGAQCLVDERTNQAYCRCPHSCSDIFAPVCGDDDVTYTSDCQLRLSACTQQRRIAPQRQGPCDIKDPCVNKECHFGSQCQPSMDGSTARCVCPEHCDPKDEKLGRRPVCGSDGRDYQNACILREVSCKEMKQIEIKYQGVCDPCDGVECSTFQVCQLDESRNPICRCNSMCSPDFRPVCGSDGKTYTNECTLRVEACKSRKNIRIIYTGECGAGSNPCDNLQCGPSQECDIDRHGVATCQCNERCEAVMRPVCGSDGETYDNACELQRQACIQKRNIDVAYRGHCGERGPCFGNHCSYGAMCVVKSDFPTCECPTCAEEFEPVCGTDGISYTNNCKLKREACEQKTEIAVAYSGLCDGCEDRRCEYYAVCESDGRGNGECVCPSSCIKVEAKVCGTDDITYDNECEMRVAACRKAQYVMVVSRGPCDLCMNIRCEYGARCEEGRCVCPISCPNIFEPVCANDGMTYSNECEMRHAACKNDQDLNILFYGECDEAGGSGQDMGSGSEVDCHAKACKYGGECDYDEEGLPICVCNFDCPALLEPVCASDGRLYDNECRVKEESCQNQKNLMPVHIEMCEEFREVPCDGEQPLVDPTTGKEYFCGDGVGSKLCPPGSYCHKSSAFAKCCSEVILIKSCTESIFGCCMDSKTPAQGPNYAGCPSVCNCNRLGSSGLTCDPDSKQCQCKPGVGGPRCDRCEPGYWGLHKITDESSGCSPCACNLYGSVRDDCEQMTGRCVCKHGIQGMKCDICPPGTVLGLDGCMDISIAQPISGSCEDLVCFHDAICRETEDHAQCICDFNCMPEDNRDLVCGSDGNTYGSECQMKLFSCRYQKTITVVSKAPCTKVLTTSHYAYDEMQEKSTRYNSIFNATHTSHKRSKRHRTKHPTGNTKRQVSKNHGKAQMNKNITFCGYSYLEIPNVSTKQQFSLDVKLRPLTKNVIILIKKSLNSSDFLSLMIRKGYLEFRLNEGHGLNVMFAKKKILMGEFHRILFESNSTFNGLKLDGKKLFWMSTDTSRPRISTLFLGSVPSYMQRYSKPLGVKDSFVGCITRIRIGKTEINPFLFLKEVGQQSASRFSRLIELNRRVVGCKNFCSFTREADELKYCLPSCKYNLTSLRTTNESSPVIFPPARARPKRADAREGLHITVVFQTQLKFGQLLLWCPEPENYISRRLRVFLREGRLQVSILWREHLAVTAQSSLHVANNRWHTATVKWTLGLLEFRVDQKTEKVLTNSMLPEIRSIGYVTIGSDISEDYDPKPTAKKFKGCINYINVNGIEIRQKNFGFMNSTCRLS